MTEQDLQLYLSKIAVCYTTLKHLGYSQSILHTKNKEDIHDSTIVFKEEGDSLSLEITFINEDSLMEEKILILEGIYEILVTELEKVMDVKHHILLNYLQQKYPSQRVH